MDVSCFANAPVRQVLGSAINNVHEDCPDEQLPIGTHSADLAEKMAEALAARVEQLVRMLCHQVQILCITRYSSISLCIDSRKCPFDRDLPCRRARTALITVGVSRLGATCSNEVLFRTHCAHDQAAAL